MSLEHPLAVPLEVSVEAVSPAPNFPAINGKAASLPEPSPENAAGAAGDIEWWEREDDEESAKALEVISDFKPGRSEREREDDEESAQAVEVTPDVKPGHRSEFKRVDHIYDKEASCWVERESADVAVVDKTDQFVEYCFTVYRSFSSDAMDSSTAIHIKSPFLKQVCRDVIGDVGGVSWNTTTVKLEPTVILAWLPRLKERLVAARSVAKPDENQALTITHLSLLLDFMSSEYSSLLEQLSGLLPNGEITFNLLWALLLPRTLLYTICPTTSEPRIVELIHAEIEEPWGMPPYWSLRCRYINSTAASDKKAARFGHSETTVSIFNFKGIDKVTSLEAYPVRFYPYQDELRAKLIARGKRWMDLDGTHHMHYDGFAWKRGMFGNMVKRVINGRVMVDKITFKRLNPNYHVAPVQGQRDESGDNSYSGGHHDTYDDDSDYYSDEPTAQKEKKPEILLVRDLTDDQLMLTPAVLYGFCLTSKQWLEFNVNYVSVIVWNEAAFANLVLPPVQKDLVQSLVEAHSQENPFDDFIEGKGQGLIFNLYGPPGIGKTMTAEATCEHVRKPLYIVKPSELGTTAESLEAALDSVFDIAHSWRAIVLLDEADVYMEQRSVHDLIRNALVAVFLRQLEYYRGILFLTTNRVKMFDEAFQSRIHVSLRFRDLDAVAKRRVWVAFLAKVGITESDLAPEEWETLSNKKINGRQIKNCVRTALALAANKKESLGFAHMAQVLTIMEQWEHDFQAL